LGVENYCLWYEVSINDIGVAKGKHVYRKRRQQPGTHCFSGSAGLGVQPGATVEHIIEAF